MPLLARVFQGALYVQNVGRTIVYSTIDFFHENYMFVRLDQFGLHSKCFIIDTDGTLRPSLNLAGGQQPELPAQLKGSQESRCVLTRVWTLEQLIVLLHFLEKSFESSSGNFADFPVIMMTSTALLRSCPMTTSNSILKQLSQFSDVHGKTVLLFNQYVRATDTTTGLFQYSLAKMKYRKVIHLSKEGK